MSNLRQLARRGRVTAFASAIAAVAAAASPAFAGPDWDFDLTEDAGKTLGTAQSVTTGGNVNSISGTLGNYPLLGNDPDGQDLYLVYVTSPMMFRVSTLAADGGSAGFNASLFAFAVEGADASVARAILANNDAFAGTSDALLVNATNDGSNIKIETPGFYLIGIALSGTQPINALGQNIFADNLNIPGLIVAPRLDVSAELFDWGGSGGPGGSYVISLDGISGTLVPAPGALALLGVGGLLRRRRR